jgi:hypothetical protein
MFFASNKEIRLEHKTAVGTVGRSVWLLPAASVQCYAEGLDLRFSARYCQHSGRLEPTQRHIPKIHKRRSKRSGNIIHCYLFNMQNISSFPSCFLPTFQLTFSFSRACYIPRQSHSPSFDRSSNIFDTIHIIQFLVRPRRSLGQLPMTSSSKYSTLQRTFNFAKGNKT